MNRRHGQLLPALALGLLAPLGCMRWNGCIPQMIATEQPAAPSARAGELTHAQAAQLCLTAGEALEKKGFTAEALRQYENARKHDPQAPTAARHLAVLYDLQGDAVNAEREYLRALHEQPHDAELLNDFGYFHYRHNHLQAAETWLRKAITADPKCACAWSNLGQVLAYQGRTEESYQAFSHVLRPAEAYSNLGILLAKQGRTAEARNALQQAVKLDPRLMQPRAFLNALGETPGPLPSDLTHSPSPVLRIPDTKQDASVAAPGSSSQASQIESMSPISNSAAPAPAWPQAMSSLTTTASDNFPGLPMIVNGPIRPRPISTRPIPAPSPRQSTPAETSMVAPQKTPPLPPPAPPSPPPLAPRPTASTEGATLIRTSAVMVQPSEPLTTPEATSPPPPQPLPPMPRLIPLAENPLPSTLQSTAPPQAVLTDCQGEQDSEHGPQ